MESKNKRFNSSRLPDLLWTKQMSRRYFLRVAGAAGIGALPFIHGCKEATMDISKQNNSQSAEKTAPVIPPIDLAAPAVTLSAFFGMG
jgi:hypothetical protein